MVNVNYDESLINSVSSIVLKEVKDCMQHGADPKPAIKLAESRNGKTIHVDNPTRLDDII